MEMQEIFARQFFGGRSLKEYALKKGNLALFHFCAFKFSYQNLNQQIHKIIWDFKLYCTNR
jgi:hypothetical protein